MANLFRQLRVAKGWSQTELGEKLGSDQRRVSLIERGLEPNPKEISKLVEIFDLKSLIDASKKHD